MKTNPSLKYYQVPEKYDQLHIPASGYTLVGGELVTGKEALKRCIKIDKLIPLPAVETKDTFISFGVRKLIKLLKQRKSAQRLEQ